MKLKRMKWIAAVLAMVIAAGVVGYKVSDASEGAGAPPPPAGPLRRAYWRALGIKTAPLVLRTVDANTQKAIPGAGCVITETGDRVETDANGVAKPIDAPIFRNPRLEQMLAELHGQLNVICYKNGYRDSIYMGVRMHEGATTETEVWMYPFGVGDRRIEPTIYQMPIHRIWRIELADKYRLRDEGEGRESPKLTRPQEGRVAPQEPMGLGLQTPIGPAPAQPYADMVPEPR
jgi:hypothetical protein